MSGNARLLVRILTAGILCNAAAAEVAFDPPLAKTVVRASVFPYYRSRHDKPIPVTVSCLYYPAFMVKVITGDPASPNRGTVVPGVKPPCLAENPDERMTGWGPFKGVRGRFIFFDTGSDMGHGEHGFVVLDGSGRMLALDDKIGSFESVRIEADALVLRYRRSTSYGCSLYYGGATECWGEIKAKSGLTDVSTPSCRDSYEALIRQYKEKHWVWQRDVWDHSATIAYNVEARLNGRKITYTARPGPVECWPTY